MRSGRAGPARGRKPDQRQHLGVDLQASRRNTAAHDTHGSAPVAKPGNNGPPVNGGQVRDTLFCRAGPGWMESVGYHARQVNDLCRRIAAELDAGGSARPLIENATLRRRIHGLRYDIEAVDWFLDQFLLPSGQSGLEGIADDPWVDLPVARVAQRTSEKYAFELQCDSAWRDFGRLPGTYLWFGKAARGLTELRTADPQTLASIRGSLNKTFSAGGKSFTSQGTYAAESPVVAELLARAARDHFGHYAKNTPIRNIQTDLGWKIPRRAQGLVDEMGTPILYTAGDNYKWRACACIMFPDQRWLRFLVRGSVLGNAIMTAVDQAGNRVARYRYRRFDRSERKVQQSPDSVEIIVHPDRKLTDELALVLAISARWLEEYFVRPQGGG
jgi:hypothetical protein